MSVFYFVELPGLGERVAAIHAVRLPHEVSPLYPIVMRSINALIAFRCMTCVQHLDRFGKSPKTLSRALGRRFWSFTERQLGDELRNQQRVDPKRYTYVWGSATRFNWDGVVPFAEAIGFDLTKEEFI